MKRREFHIGPGAASLILIAVVTAMSILGLLSLMNARADLQMARRSAGVATDVAALDASSEQRLAELDAILSAIPAETDEEYLSLLAENLPQDMILDGRTVLWTEYGADGRTLECGAEVARLGESPRIYWMIHRHWAGLGGDFEL